MVHSVSNVQLGWSTSTEILIIIITALDLLRQVLVSVLVSVLVYGLYTNRKTDS